MSDKNKFSYKDFSSSEKEDEEFIFDLSHYLQHYNDDVSNFFSFQQDFLSSSEESNSYFNDPRTFYSNS